MKATTNTTQILSLQNRCGTLLLALFTFMMFHPCARAAEEVPFKGFAAGAITGMEPGPAGVTITVHAVGNSTQLGRFTREETLLLDPATMTVTGTIVFTAANGDQLIAIVAGAFTSPTTVEGTYTFNGGTGRYADAVGSAVFVASTNGGLVGVEFAGAISSVGAK
jgi:hypothetical protein